MPATVRGGDGCPNGRPDISADRHANPKSNRPDRSAIDTGPNDCTDRGPDPQSDHFFDVRWNYRPPAVRRIGLQPADGSVCLPRHLPDVRQSSVVQWRTGQCKVFNASRI